MGMQITQNNDYTYKPRLLREAGALFPTLLCTLELAVPHQTGDS